MSLKARIDTDIKEAMKAKDQGRLRALRAIKSAILLAETSEGSTGELTESQELALLTRQAKQRRDSIEQFEASGRTDLSAGEREELAVIETYLPKALSPEELEAEIRALIAEVGATSAADLGKVMKAATTRFAGKADNKVVSETVKRLLAS